MNFKKNILNFKNKNKGFTLFELLVSISIFVLMTIVVLFNYSQFNGTILLTDLAYQVALSIREAQVYGTSVKVPFTAPYGVNFTSDPSSYLVFADTSTVGNNNKQYDSGDILVKKYNLQRGNKIQSVCVTGGTSSGHCLGTEFQVMNILFLRPDPDARFNIGGSDFDSTINEVTITLSNSNNLQTKKIIVNSTGQISVPAN